MMKKMLGMNMMMYIKSFFPSKKDKEMLLQRRAFYSKFLRKGDLYFDVGANYGNRIQPIVDLGIKIVAIEPQDSCLRFLRKKFGNRIEIVPLGLGGEEQEKDMYISNESTLSSFSKDWIDATKKSGRFSQYKWNKTKKVKITTLDFLISKFGKPNFIKIDVEGYELEVLNGLSNPIPMLSFEYTTPERQENTLLCLKRLDEISNHEIHFNYSIGESMKWALENWVSYSEMCKLVVSQDFINTDFGDVYARWQMKLPNQ